MSSGVNGDGHASTSSGRRREDQELVAALRATGFRGLVYDRFVADATRYATGWLWKMARTGEIFGYLEKIKRRRARPLCWGYHDIEDLVAASVADGFLDFHTEALVNDRWDPSRASLYTLLVSFCATRFADHYEQWRRRSVTRLVQEASCDPDCRGAQPAPSAERVALGRQAVDELSREQFAKAVGYDNGEIGQIFGTTARGVEGRLHRDRRATPEMETGGGGKQ